MHCKDATAGGGAENRCAAIVHRSIGRCTTISPPVSAQGISPRGNADVESERGVVENVVFRRRGENVATVSCQRRKRRPCRNTRSNTSVTRETPSCAPRGFLGNAPEITVATCCYFLLYVFFFILYPIEKLGNNWTYLFGTSTCIIQLNNRTPPALRTHL